jgi:protein TonB
MFDDLKERSPTPARARFGGSLAVALAVYGAAGALLIGASATARQVVEEKLTQVTFAVAPPAPEPPPPPPPVVEASPQAEPPRAKAKRATLKPPTELPTEKPRESDQPLAAAEPSGPVDGFLDGVEGGRGAAPAPPPPPPPAPPPAVVVPPVALQTNARPSYSTRARIERVEGTVVVSFEVLENGQVAEARVLSGPRELHESVLKTVMSWRFKPAQRGGTPVRFKKTQSIVFRLEDA